MEMLYSWKLGEHMLYDPLNFGVCLKILLNDKLETHSHTKKVGVSALEGPAIL